MEAENKKMDAESKKRERASALKKNKTKTSVVHFNPEKLPETEMLPISSETPEGMEMPATN